MGIRYRPEIDGLRTIAVMSVIVYHAEFDIGGQILLPGGFLGVDIFFVISGFLITSLILKEIGESGGFSLPGFYERRARRLLPALLMVMLASIAAAWQILLPAQLVDFAKSLAASLFFVSNFYWDLGLQEYGAESGLLKPFLHTWSLAVEEQYYILFPLILVAIHRLCRAWLTTLLVGGFFASLGFAQWLTHVDPHSSFYMLPSRFWELLAGGLLAHILLYNSPGEQRSIFDAVMPWLGLALLCWSFLYVDHDSHHPGLITLLCVAGTVLIILYAHPREMVTRVLSSRLFVGIGLISYSLYLWHFPILAFARNLRGELQPLELCGLIVLTFLLAIGGYYLVEKPMRNRTRVSVRQLLGLLGALTIVVMAFVVYSIQRDGVRERFSELDVLYGQAEFDNELLQDQSWILLQELALSRGVEGVPAAQEPSEFDAQYSWFSVGDKKQKVLLIGNSASKDLFNAFYQNQSDFPHHEFARFGMHPIIRKDHIEALLVSPNFQAADVLVLNFLFFPPRHLTTYFQFLERLATYDKKIYLTSSPIIFLSKEKMSLFDWYLQREMGEDDGLENIRSVFYKSQMHGVVRLTNESIEEFARQHDLEYLELKDLVCNEREKTCDGVTPQGFKSYYDNIHWTLKGSEHFGSKILDLGWFPRGSDVSQ